MPPPMSRPGGQQQSKAIEDMTLDEAKLALAQLRTERPTDADFETILEARLKAVEEGSRAQHKNAGEAIEKLEAHIEGLK